MLMSSLAGFRPITRILFFCLLSLQVKVSSNRFFWLLSNTPFRSTVIMLVVYRSILCSFLHKNKADNISAIRRFRKLPRFFCYADSVSSAASTPTVMTHALKKIPACISITSCQVLYIEIIYIYTILFS